MSRGWGGVGKERTAREGVIWNLFWVESKILSRTDLCARVCLRHRWGEGPQLVV